MDFGPKFYFFCSRKCRPIETNTVCRINLARPVSTAQCFIDANCSRTDEFSQELLQSAFFLQPTVGKK